MCVCVVGVGGSADKEVHLLGPGELTGAIGKKLDLTKS